MAGDVVTEAEFADQARRFLVELRGPEVPVVQLDDDLANDAGLDSLQLIALLEFVERLRGAELEEIPELGKLTLRNLYWALLRSPASGPNLPYESLSDREEL